MKRCVPAYIWSGNDDAWARALDGLSDGDVLVVTGPDSGPPTTKAQRVELAPRIAQARDRAEVTVLGYAPWGYGHRRHEHVVNDANEWRAMRVDGVFIDEAPDIWTTDLRRKAVAIHGFIRANLRPADASGRLRGVSLFNAGTWHESMGDVMRALPGSLWCTWEGAWAQYPTNAKASSSWPLREVHLIHSCPTPTDVDTAAARMRKAGVGWGFATTDTLPNPWDGVA